MTEYKTIEYAVADRVATITLARPERLNAWTGRMHTEYRRAVAAAEADADVRVLVVTGKGRGFCAGADSAALDGHIEKGAYDPGIREPLAEPGYGVRTEFDHAFAFHYGLRLPVIAAINGPAAGVGLVLACYADLRFAAAGAKLTAVHGRLGLPAEYGLSWVLPRLIGLTRAADLLLSSRVVRTEEAAEMGLVNRVLPPDALLPVVYEYARVLAHEVSPASIVATKRQLYADLHGDVGASVVDAEQRLEEHVKGADYREGVKALLEKRPPAF
ncbi:MAG TPA: enoyl-CoA hydratase-related protein [Acidimicrobiales bacterium]|nr:enoyl-CoA hydratase-related protein [Acidimicrobiales bacterium]